MKRPRRKPRPQEVQQPQSEPFFKKIQTKIAIGKADDPYEREADSVADKVVSSGKNGAANLSTTPLANQISPLAQRSTEEETQAKLQRQEEEEAAQMKIQRQEEEEAAQTKIQRMGEEEEPQAKLQRMGEEEEPQAKLQRMEEEEPQAKLQRQEEEEAQAKLQRQEEEEAAQTKLQKQEEEEAQAKTQNQTPKTPTVSSKVETQLSNKKGRGQAMDSKTRQKMESGFGADFGHINIHTDATAIAMCQELGAHAFTYGNDIYFNEGKYNPDHAPDQHLLAHELTHTIQQKGAIQKKLQRAPKFASGAAPFPEYQEVDPAQRPRVNKALRIIKKIIDNPNKYKACHDFFQNNNPGNTTLAEVFDRLNIWFDTDNSVWGSSDPPNEIAYSAETWRWGRWSLAGVFVHEMMHLAGQDNEATDDKAITKCGLPDIDKK